MTWFALIDEILDPVLAVLSFAVLLYIAWRIKKGRNHGD